MMRKMFLLLSALFLVFALTACGDSDGGGSVKVSEISVSGSVYPEDIYPAAVEGTVEVIDPQTGDTLTNVPIENGRFTVTFPKLGDQFAILFIATVSGEELRNLSFFDLTVEPGTLVTRTVEARIIIDEDSTVFANDILEGGVTFPEGKGYSSWETHPNGKKYAFSFKAGDLDFVGQVGGEQPGVPGVVASGVFNVVFDDISYSSVDNNTTVKFNIVKNDNFMKNKPDQLRIMAIEFDPNTKKFTTSFSFTTPEYNLEEGAWVAKTSDNVDLTSKNSFVYIYAADERTGIEKGRIILYKYVANVGKKFGNWTYDSTANVSGCEKCHGEPYLKHGYRGAKADGLEDFVACKGCHYDTRNGSHYFWQIIVDDIETAIKIHNGDAQERDYADEYAYKASVMNDVHMSHSMEFAYPQSFKNCVTCHEGKLDKILTDENFTLETCKSCHPVDGYELNSLPNYKGETSPIGTKEYALDTIIPHQYAENTQCNQCHTSGSTGIAPTFKEIHAGYDTAIYFKKSDGSLVKYKDLVKVTIDNVTYNSSADNVTLTVKASITSTEPSIDVSKAQATAVVAFYGYDTKDMMFTGHSFRNKLEVGIGKPSLDGVWTHTFNISDASQDIVNNITNGNIKRIEVGILPKLYNSDEEQLAISAVSKTYNIETGKFDTEFEKWSKNIVDVKKCNACHEELAVEFHTPDYSGDTTAICRICHEPTNGAAHLELQSRSLDSYIHAIHSMQYLDGDAIVPATFDNVTLYPDQPYAYEAHKMFKELHMEEVYPMFTTLNCESCHNPGTYDVPDQKKSLGGVLKGSADETIPQAVSGPGSRACGSCHRSMAFNEGNMGEVVSINFHAETFGYFDEGGSILTILPLTYAAGSTEKLEQCATCHKNTGSGHQQRYNNYAVNPEQK